MTMTPSEKNKVEAITALYTQAILRAKFESPDALLELAKRCAAINDAEIKFINDHELKRIQMMAWGPAVN